MSINHKSVEFHQCHGKPHSICFLFITISKITKEILPRFVVNWKHRLGLESARAALCKWATCTRQTFLSKTFAESLNIQKQYEKNVWEKSNDAYLLSIRVQTTIFYVFMFFATISTPKKFFLSEGELKKALRDTLTRAAWLGPSDFWLVRPGHGHPSYPGLFFRPPGFSPYMGREERRVRGLDYWSCCWVTKVSRLSFLQNSLNRYQTSCLCMQNARWQLCRIWLRIMPKYQRNRDMEAPSFEKRRI